MANISKARRTLYSLMSSGMHSQSGLNPASCHHIWKVYVLPVLTYGLEIFNLNQGDTQSLKSFQTKTFRQLLGLPNNTPSCALLTLI
jgi:hypothetical protein